MRQRRLNGLNISSVVVPENRLYDSIRPSTPRVERRGYWGNPVSNSRYMCRREARLPNLKREREKSKERKKNTDERWKNHVVGDRTESSRHMLAFGLLSLKYSILPCCKTGRSTLGVGEGGEIGKTNKVTRKKDSWHPFPIISDSWRHRRKPILFLVPVVVALLPPSVST